MGKLYPTTKSFTVYTDAVGCWKMSSFVNNLNKAHLHTKVRRASVSDIPLNTTSIKDSSIQTSTSSALSLDPLSRNPSEAQQEAPEENNFPPTKRQCLGFCSQYGTTSTVFSGFSDSGDGNFRPLIISGKSHPALMSLPSTIMSRITKQIETRGKKCKRLSTQR